MKPLFSIITSCFNSSNTLLVAYNSLLKQRPDIFEWILVDDASADSGKTRELFELIKDKAPFKVKTIYLEQNFFGSKSVFCGAQIADGEYIAILDHDDQLVDDCLEIVRGHIEATKDVRGRLAGICGRCVDENKNLIGDLFNENRFVANEGNVRFKMGNTCELFQFTKTDLVIEFFRQMKPGYTNGFVWAKISEKKYDYVFVNDVFRVYDTSFPGSYSNTKSMHVRYPSNKAEALKNTIFSYRPYLRFNIIYASKLIASFLRHTMNAEMPVSSAISEFDTILKLWAVLLLPISYLKARNFI